jgi:para-aminobenzoate synthetase/4-amino-4-deoxychorismate lyase
MKAPIPLPEAICALAANEPGTVLLQTSRFDKENQCSYLFRNPVRILTATLSEELEELFQQMEEALAAGYFVAGFLAYEAGYALQKQAFHHHRSSNNPLAWLGVFGEPICFNHMLGDFSRIDVLKTTLPASSSELFTLKEVALDISPQEYAEKIQRIQEYIAAGATYQINFTDKIHLHTQASHVELYLALSRQQPVSYNASINTGDQQVLSMSPELFFRVQNGRITTRPMKGTWPRGRDITEDAIAALKLQNDEKNRSEHLMIVDLLRNDLGRICTTGSVRVDDLFSVERYPTLLQMTSTVSGKLPQSLPWIDIFRSLFPSGSITGAPKLSSMGIIREMEKVPRGIYTGSIGYISPTGDSVFNVAIRTLVHRDGQLSMGVGGGIVMDSNAEKEYAECRLKAAFLTHPQKHELIETMRWDNIFVRLDLHMERLQTSCEYFDFPFEPEQILNELDKLARAFYPLSRHRVRLTLDNRGRIKLSTSPLSDTSDTCRVTLASERTISSDAFLRHKTTRRALYDHSLAAAQANGFDEVLFLNEHGELTEGAISNIFLRSGDRLFTPPLNCGVLPGVFRRHLLEALPAAEECILFLSDLHKADAAYLCSSLRGMRRILNADSYLVDTASTES